jgi:molybdopterin-guanine dinucleotide biosynthesis protein A
MGGNDKGLCLLAGQPLLAHVRDRLAPQCDRLAINSNAAPESLADLGLPVVPDIVPDRPGPLAGILTAMDWAMAQGENQVVTAPGDTPFLPGDLIPRLLLAAETAPDVPVLAESAGRLHPVAGLWPVSLRDDLARALTSGTRRVTEWTTKVQAISVAFPATGLDPFFNVNAPEDLATAEAALSV